MMLCCKPTNSSNYLVLFLLKSTFCLLQGPLQFLLLHLQPSPLFVQLMDRPATITELVKKILDLISQILEMFCVNWAI